MANPTPSHFDATSWGPPLPHPNQQNLCLVSPFVHHGGAIFFILHEQEIFAITNRIKFIDLA